jgi:sugar phosphate isomerase/epimerase
MGKIPIALQLYSVRQDCENDVIGTVKAVAKMGYEGVEFAGYYNRSAKELRSILDDTGLKVAGTHIGLDTLLGDELKRTVEFNRTLGNKFLVVPGLDKSSVASKEGWLNAAKSFNEISEKLVPEGMQVGYHNHALEFSPMEGEVPWDIFFGNTNAKVVMQLDAGNALRGGADPVPYLERYPGRAYTVHLKEFSKAKKGAVIGEGEVRWNDLFKLCESTGNTEWYIVEQESYAFPPLECVERCLQNLKKMSK